MERKTPTVYETGNTHWVGLPPFIKELAHKYPQCVFRAPTDRFAQIVQVSWIDDNRFVGFDLNIHQEDIQIQADVEAYLGKA